MGFFIAPIEALPEITVTDVVGLLCLRSEIFAHMRSGWDLSTYLSGGGIVYQTNVCSDPISSTTCIVSTMFIASTISLMALLMQQ